MSSDQWSSQDQEVEIAKAIAERKRRDAARLVINMPPDAPSTFMEDQPKHGKIDSKRGINTSDYFNFPEKFR